MLALLPALLLSAQYLVGSNGEVAGRGGLAPPASGGSWDHPGSITLVLSALGAQVGRAHPVGAEHHRGAAGGSLSDKDYDVG